MDNRKHVRLPVDHLATFTGDTLEGEGQLVNLSLEGAEIDGNISLSKGEYLQIRLYLPDDDVALQIDMAPVRWAKEKKFGVEFISMTEQAQGRLRQYVKSLSTE